MPSAPASFDHLAEAHRPEILAYLIRLLGDQHDAEDACQETFLRAYRAFNRLAAGTNARAWLYKIATNIAFNTWKRRRREKARSVDMDWETLPFDSTSVLNRREDLRAVARALETLPPKQRAALMQRQFQGLSYAEIALTLGCSEEAARANVYQAIKKLREMLVDREEA